MEILYTILSVAVLIGFYIIVKTVLKISKNQEDLLKSLQEQGKINEKRNTYVDALIYDIKETLQEQNNK